MSLISKFVPSQLPQHIVDDFPLFVDFIQAYYEWMEQPGGPIELMENSQYLFNPDESLDQFVDQFLYELGANFPKNITISKTDLLKRLKDVYSAKGTPLAYKLLFKILFGGDETEVSYGYDRVLIASGANWVEEISFKTKSLIGDPQLADSNFLQYFTTDSFGNKTVLGSLVIEKIITYFENGEKVYEIFSARTNLKGTFPQGGQFRFGSLPETEYLLEPFVTTSRVDIVSSTTGFVRGEIFEATQAPSGAGTIIRVVAIDDQTRAVKADIISFGSGYTGESFAQTFYETPTKYLTAEFQVGIQSIYTGYWSDSKSKISDYALLQDNLKYQSFSYIIKTGNSINRWRDIVKNVLHPAGMYFSGEIAIIQKTLSRTKVDITADTNANRYKFLRDTISVSEEIKFEFDKYLRDPLPAPDDALYYTDDIDYLGDIESELYSYFFAYRYIPEYDGLGANDAIQILLNGVEVYRTENFNDEDSELIANTNGDLLVAGPTTNDVLTAKSGIPGL